MEPGTDLTAILWKSLQSTQIQTQLDQSHNLYEIVKENSDSQSDHHDDSGGAMRPSSDNENLDKQLRKLRKSKKLLVRPKNAQVNVYANRVRHTFEAVYSLLKEGAKEEVIKETISQELMDKPLYPDTGAAPTMSVANLSNFIDIRKSKDWVFYYLSDHVPRKGSIHPHFIYTKVPGWLYDASRIANEKGLFLIYSTDMRGVSEWMGQLCSLINMHNLLSINLESQQGINCTAILIHLAGLLSTRPINSINRQGMHFPNSILQKCTFENVKNCLAKIEGTDDLSSFVSATIACLPHRTGTNSFDVMST